MIASGAKSHYALEEQSCFVQAARFCAGIGGLPRFWKRACLSCPLAPALRSTRDPSAHHSKLLVKQEHEM